MMCYRDMTFCADSKRCANTSCHRNFTEEEHTKAIKWWGDDSFPLAISPMAQTCKDFKEQLTNGRNE